MRFILNPPEKANWGLRKGIPAVTLGLRLNGTAESL